MPTKTERYQTVMAISSTETCRKPHSRGRDQNSQSTTVHDADEHPSSRSQYDAPQRTAYLTVTRTCSDWTILIAHTVDPADNSAPTTRSAARRDSPRHRPRDSQLAESHRLMTLSLSHTISPSTTATSVVAISRVRRLNRQRSQGAARDRREKCCEPMGERIIIEPIG